MHKGTTKDTIPEKLNFEIGDFGGGYSVIELRNRKLYYSQPRCFGLSSFHDAEVNPSPSEWEKFSDKVDELRVWKWKKRYDNRDILDGTQWSLELQINDKKVKSSGSNEYPESFDLFLKEMSELLALDVP